VLPAPQADTGTGGDSLTPPLQLYSRWERQHWAADSYDFTGDTQGWDSLRPYVRAEIRYGIVQFFLGEISVTQTLGPIAHAAPTHEAQIFLCTQMADEARHTYFFQRYLQTVEPDNRGLQAIVDGYWTEASAGQVTLFDHELRRLTDRIRLDPNDVGGWYQAIALYHLMLEGVLAITGQKTLIRAARSVGCLPVLEDGLLHIARDESRHVGFGLGSLREGVRDGYGEPIAEVVRKTLDSVVHTIVNPDRPVPRMLIRATVAGIAVGPETLWEAARLRLLKRLELIGLGGLVSEADRSWNRARDDALAHYATVHNQEHPARGRIAASASG
jgi:ribonucleoside-diphosphate reductase beta chain